MTRLLLCLMLLGPASARAAGPGPEYFIVVQNGETGGGKLEESYKALAGMVKLADAQNVKLTLLFSAQYADFIATDTARLAEFEGWKQTGHEIGAYHQGPDTGGWDGYSDLPAADLVRVRKKEAIGGHEAFFSALGRLSPVIKTACMAGGPDERFLAAAPAYEVCGGPDLMEGRYGIALKGKSGAGYRGVNEFLTVYGGSATVKKSLVCFHPADKAGIDAAEGSFSGLSSGVYGTAFKSLPSEFGAFYVWLGFLRGVDPQGQRSRTVSVIVDAKTLSEKEFVAVPKKDTVAARKKEKVKAPVKAEPAATPKTELPRLKPIQSIYGKVGRLRLGPLPGRTLKQGGYCGDGTCDAAERADQGRCPRDCGGGRSGGNN